MFMQTKTSKFLIVFLVFLVSAFSVEAQQKLNRKTSLSRIKKCAVKLTTLNCNEGNAEFLIELYKKGDKSLLNPLLDADRNSDGALSEILGVFYADVLVEQTYDFLLALSNRPKSEQAKLVESAVIADGSGNTASWKKKTTGNLKKFALNKNRKLASVAKICLRKLDEISNS